MGHTIGRSKYTFCDSSASSAQNFSPECFVLVDSGVHLRHCPKNLNTGTNRDFAIETSFLEHVNAISGPDIGTELFCPLNEGLREETVVARACKCRFVSSGCSLCGYQPDSIKRTRSSRDVVGSGACPTNPSRRFPAPWKMRVCSAEARPILG